MRDRGGLSAHCAMLFGCHFPAYPEELTRVASLLSILTLLCFPISIGMALSSDS